jgi:hypothetical protein
MCKRLHRIAIIGMQVTALLGIALAIRGIVHHSSAPASVERSNYNISQSTLPGR